MIDTTKKLVLTAMFITLGLVLPFLTGQIPQIATMLLPMHIPVLLCGFICGWKYGGFVGFILPLLRYVLFGMPVLFPMGISMAFELATYGLVVGLVYAYFQRQTLVILYSSLIIAMLSGRIVWGIVQMLLLGIQGEGFTWQMFITGIFLSAIPGILLQLILIPTIMVSLQHAGVLPYQKTKVGITNG